MLYNKLRLLEAWAAESGWDIGITPNYSFKYSHFPKNNLSSIDCMIFEIYRKNINIFDCYEIKIKLLSVLVVAFFFSNGETHILPNLFKKWITNTFYWQFETLKAVFNDFRHYFFTFWQSNHFSRKDIS